MVKASSSSLFVPGSKSAYAFVHLERGSQSEQPAFRDGPQCCEIFRSETANGKVSIPVQRSAGEDPPFSTSLFHACFNSYSLDYGLHSTPDPIIDSAAPLLSRGSIANVSGYASGMPIKRPV